MAVNELMNAIALGVSDFHRLSQLQQVDWRAAVGEMEISIGMPSEHVELADRAEHYYRTSNRAKQQLYEAVAQAVRNDSTLYQRISPLTLLRALEVQIAQICIEQNKSIDAKTTLGLFRQAKALR